MKTFMSGEILIIDLCQFAISFIFRYGEALKVVERILAENGVDLEAQQGI